MAANMTAEQENVVNLKGMPQNPARDPKAKSKDGRGTIGDTAFKDALIIVIAAWLFLVFLAVSLRHHNV